MRGPIVKKLNAFVLIANDRNKFVLRLEFWSLEIVWNLVLVIWCFLVLSMFPQVLKSFGLHLVTRQGIERVNFDVVAQVRLQSELILQLGEDGFTVFFLFG